MQRGSSEYVRLSAYGGSMKTRSTLLLLSGRLRASALLDVGPRGREVEADALRPVSLHTSSVVPLPQNGSSTRSPSEVKRCTTFQTTYEGVAPR